MKYLKASLTLSFATLTALVGCSEPRRYPERRHRMEPVREEAPPPPPQPSTQIFFYPTKGQSADQQSRDRYECYLWSVKQTGFDPSLPQVAPHLRVDVVPVPPPGHDTVAGAITGAVVGASVVRPRNAGEGAVVGAVAGAVLGAASDSARQEEADRIQRRYDQRDAEINARLEEKSSAYRRAMSACLEGRGYAIETNTSTAPPPAPAAPPVPSTSSHPES